MARQPRQRSGTDICHVMLFEATLSQASRLTGICSEVIRKTRKQKYGKQK